MCAFSLKDNDTLCETYVPDADEYRQNLAVVWPCYMVIGCTTFICLMILFVKQMFWVSRVTPLTLRYHIIWIASIFPVMTLVSVVGFLIPRAWQVCCTTKLLYLMIGISKFVDLTVGMYGGEDAMLFTLKDTRFQLGVLPCVCCWFMPKPLVTKKPLRWVLFGCYQLPFTQASYFFILMILTSFGYKGIGSVEPRETYVWLTLYRVVSTVTGVYSLNIIAKLSTLHLSSYQYTKKSAMIRALILITVLQSTLFDVLSHYHVLPCILPLSYQVYGATVESCVYIVEMLMFGVYNFQQYRQKEFTGRTNQQRPSTVRSVGPKHSLEAPPFPLGRPSIISTHHL